MTANRKEPEKKTYQIVLLPLSPAPRRSILISFLASRASSLSWRSMLSLRDLAPSSWIGAEDPQPYRQRAIREQGVSHRVQH